MTLALCALLVGSSAAARDKVLVVPFGGVHGASAEDASHFTQILQAQLGLENLLWAPPAPEERKSPVRGDFAEARRLYRARRFPQAKARLERAFGALSRDAAAFDSQEVAGAYVLLGAIELRSGNERRCLRALEQALRADAQYRPPRGAYPPILDRELGRARQTLARVARFPLTIDGPDGADVLLDGKRIGILPGVHTRALAGTHHLRLKGVNGEDFSEWVVVKGATKLPVVFPPSPDHQPLPVLADSKLTSEWAADLARALGVRHAELAVVGVLARAADGGFEAHAGLFQRDGAGFTEVTPIHFDGQFHAAEGEALVLAERISEAVDGKRPRVVYPHELLAPLPTVTAPVESNRPPVGDTSTRRIALAPVASPPTAAALPAAPATAAREDERSGSFFSRVPTWVWIVGGVGVAAGAGATYYAIHQHNQPVTGTVEATW